MENTSSETTPAAVTEAPAAPARRSRRATAATGEVVATPVAAAPTSADGAEPAPEAPKKRATRSRASKPAATDAAGADTTSTEAVKAAPVTVEDAEAPKTAEEAPAPKKRATRSRKKAVDVEAAAVADSASSSVSAEASAATGAASEAAAAPAGEELPAPKKRQPRSRKKAAEADTASAQHADDTVSSAAPETAVAADAPAESTRSAAAEHGEAATDTATTPAVDKPQRTRNRNGQNRRAQAAAEAEASRDNTAETADAPAAQESKSSAAKNDDAKSGESQARSNRTRQRERKRRGQNEDFEVDLAEDDVLLPIAGILDVLENYAFVRTSGYLPGTNDVYVSLGQVKKYDLRKGDAVVGAIRQPRDNEGNSRQKYNAIVRVDSVNSRPVDDAQPRPEFSTFTAIQPETQLVLEGAQATLAPRILDLFAPIGAGQRGVARGVSGSGKTALLREIAAAVSQNQPDTHLMFVSLEARPEEITELQRSINGEVIGSSFDRPVEDHTTAAELAIERAKRLVELGHDVLVLIDSVTQLGRAYQQQAQGNTRTPSVGFDAAQLMPLKRLLSAARNIENGGSLSIIATANDASVSQADERILEELRSVWNTEIVLSGELARHALFPAIDVVASYTRNAAQLIGENTVAVLAPVRRALAERSAQESAHAVHAALGQHANNVEFVALAQRKPVL